MMLPITAKLLSNLISIALNVYIHCAELLSTVRVVVSCNVHAVVIQSSKMINEATIILLLGFVIVYSVPVSKTTSLHAAYQTFSTPLGDIQGSMLTSRQKKNIYSFRGIRYAKAPVEELRFQDPVIPDKWEGVYNATQDGISCPQPFVETESEDCLLLNVYTTKMPKGNDHPKRPVLVFFHEGDFTNKSGISSLLGPQYLLDQDIVLVTSNYRLGVLGFLNTGDKEATGNYGLKDQVEVLKWVKANIAAFGGNPEEVTIAGSGSGSISVSLHLVSTLSKGLFHRAIMVGGTAYGNIPVANNQLDLAKKLAKELNCSDDTSANMVKCFRSKTANELTDVKCALREMGKHPYYLWLPTIEQDFGQFRFLTAHPIELVSHDQLNKVPVLVGGTTDEFAASAFAVVNNETVLEQFDKDFDTIAPIAFMYERDTDHSKTISKELKAFYFPDGKVDNTTVSKFVEIFTDALSGFGIDRITDVLIDKSNESVYYFRFNYKGRYSNFYLPESNNTTPYGVVHGDDMIYLFNSANFADFKESDDEVAIIQKMVTIWGNFVDSGKPIPTVTDILDNIKWEPYTAKSKKYMEIGNKLVMMEDLNEKRYSEWEKLFPTSKYSKIHSG